MKKHFKSRSQYQKSSYKVKRTIDESKRLNRMLTELKAKLSKLIKLQDIKIVKKDNKKIISTSIFIPSEFNYNMRSLYYFQGLVKSVETFKQVMGDTDYIYRIYYDSMFDDNLVFDYKKKTLKKNATARNRKTTRKRNLQKKTEAIHSRRNNTGLRNEYKHGLNKKAYNLTMAQMNELLLAPNESKKLTESNKILMMFNKSRTKINAPKNSEFKTINNKTKKNVYENYDSFKKLLKLYYLYIQKIKKNEGNRYNNIELISYTCKSIKKNPDFLGHSSTFGSFIRFFPILDNDVSLYYCTNSTHQITPVIKHYILEWEQSDKDILGFEYSGDSRFNIVKKYLIDNIDLVKKNTKESNITKKNEAFIGVINGMFNVNNLINEDNDIITNNTLDNMTHLSNKKSLKPKLKYSKDDTELMYLNELLQNRHEDKTSYKNLLYNTAYITPDLELFKCIGAGIFGIKKSLLFIEKRYDNLIRYIDYIITHDEPILYGIDEVMLKYILIPDIHITDGKLNFMYKILRTDRGNPHYYSNLKNEKYTYLKLKTSLNTSNINSEKQTDIGIIFNKLDVKDIEKYIILDNKWLYQIDIEDSRSLYEKAYKPLFYFPTDYTLHDDNQFLPSDNIVINIYDNYLNFDALFRSFNEPRKLIVYDNSLLFRNFMDKDLTYRQHILTKKKIMEKYFILRSLQDYNIGHLNKLLNYIITHYNTNIIIPEINIIKPIIYSEHSSSNDTSATTVSTETL